MKIYEYSFKGYITYDMHVTVYEVKETEKFFKPVDKRVFGNCTSQLRKEAIGKLIKSNPNGMKMFVFLTEEDTEYAKRLFCADLKQMIHRNEKEISELHSYIEKVENFSE